jgi:hypothetical protein
MQTIALLRIELEKNEKSPGRRAGAFLVLLSVRATRGGCPYLPCRRGSLAFMEASGTFIPSSLPGNIISRAPAMGCPAELFAMKPLDDADFRARRHMLEKDDFALASGEYSGPANLIDEDTWKSIVVLSDDVSIRTSDRYGSQLQQMWDYWDMWIRVVGGVQVHSSDPTKSATAIAACDASDEFQAATFAALVGYYRVAFSCLRNVLEQVTIAAQLTISNDAKGFADWRNGEDRIRFGWAADLLPKNQNVAALERHLGAATKDSLFNQVPKGLARRFFVEVSKYTHGASGFTDGDSRQSNGPIFLAKTFLQWCVAALKTYAIALHEIKVAHPTLDKLPWGPPTLRLDEFRRKVVADIPPTDRDRAFFQSLADFWP